VTNSAAYYRGVKADPEAGRINATAAKFLQDIAQPLGKIAGERKKEFAEAERNAGIASFTRATPEQREKMRNAIKAGIISESESPYFREGVSIAYTKSLLGKYNQDLFQKYEDWPDKNKEDSGNFDRFLDEFDGGYAANFETIHEDILTEHFIPGQMGIRRQLQQRHTEHLNKNYRQKAFGLKESEFFEILKGYPEDLVKEMLNNPTTGVKRLVERGRDGNTQDLDRMTLVTTILNSDTITKEQREQLSQFPDGQQLLKDLDALQGKKEKTKAVATTSIETGKPVGPESVLLKQEVKKSKKPTPTGKPDSVKVKKGDTVSRLAERYGLTEEEFLSYNPQIKDKNKIGLGDKVNLVKPTDYSELEQYPGQLSEVWFGSEGLMESAKKQGMGIGMSGPNDIIFTGGPHGSIKIDKKKGESKEEFERRALNAFKFLTKEA
jgi:LysM repeat protein